MIGHGHTCPHFFHISMMRHIAVIKKDMDPGYPNAIDKAHTKAMEKILTGANPGNDVSTKDKYHEPKQGFDLLRYQRYGTKGHDQSENGQLKDKFPVHN